MVWNATRTAESFMTLVPSMQDIKDDLERERESREGCAPMRCDSYAQHGCIETGRITTSHLCCVWVSSPKCVIRWIYVWVGREENLSLPASWSHISSACFRRKGRVLSKILFVVDCIHVFMCRIVNNGSFFAWLIEERRQLYPDDFWPTWIVILSNYLQ